MTLARRCPRIADLSVRADRARLPANAAEVSPAKAAFQQVLAAESGASWPRVVTALSQRGQPFDLNVVWTAGQGIGGDVTITASGGVVRFNVLAATLRISVANWINGEHLIGLTVEDGEGGGGGQQGLHKIERALGLANAGEQEFAVPAFAREVRLATADPAQGDHCVISLLDSVGAVMAAFNADEGFVPVGAASKVRVRNNSGAALASFTLDYLLGL